MKVPNERTYLGKPCKIIAGGKPYLYYRDTEQSNEDMVLWLHARKAPTSFASLYDYVAYLKSKGYFEDDLINYYTNTKRYFDQNK